MGGVVGNSFSSFNELWQKLFVEWVERDDVSDGLDNFRSQGLSRRNNETYHKLPVASTGIAYATVEPNMSFVSCMGNCEEVELFGMWPH